MEDCSTDERLQQETLCLLQLTDEYVECPGTLMRQNVVVVWVECPLVDVVRHIGMLVHHTEFHNTAFSLLLL